MKLKALYFFITLPLFICNTGNAQNQQLDSIIITHNDKNGQKHSIKKVKQYFNYKNNSKQILFEDHHILSDFEYIQKKDYFYDVENQIEKIVSSTKNKDQWYTEQTETTNYDRKGRILSYEEKIDHAENWTSYRTEKDYKDTKIISIEKTIVNEMEQNTSKQETSFLPNSELVTELVVYDWDSDTSNWYPVKKQEKNYDTQQQLTKSKDFNYIDSHWQLTSRTELNRSYEKEAKDSTTILISYKIFNTEEYPETKIECTTHTTSNKVTSITYNWDESTQKWEPQTKDVITYNNIQQELESYEYHWTNKKWSLYRSSIKIYDHMNYILEQKEYVYKDEEIDRGFKKIFQYDTHYNLIQETYDQYDTSKENWVTYNINQFSYDDTIVHQSDFILEHHDAISYDLEQKNALKTIRNYVITKNGTRMVLNYDYIFYYSDKK